MKRLNQNNTIAPTAMMTKLNTMKDKMNFFAKVVMLLVMMGMLLPDVSWGLVDKKAWQNVSGTWYILHTGGEVSLGRDQERNYTTKEQYTISPVSCTDVISSVTFIKTGGNSDVNFRFVVAGNNYDVTAGWGDSRKVVTVNCTIPQRSNAITCDVQYQTGGGTSNNKEKKFSAAIPVPVHCCTTSTVFGKTVTCEKVQYNAVQGTGISASEKVIPVTDFFSTFLTATNGNIKFKITNVKKDNTTYSGTGKAQKGLFYIGKNNNKIDKGTDGQYEIYGGNAMCQTGYSQTAVNVCNDNISIFFDPTETGSYKATIEVYKDGSKIGDFTISAQCTKATQKIVWNLTEADKIISTQDPDFDLTGDKKATVESNNLTYVSSDSLVLEVIKTNGVATALRPHANGTATITVSSPENETYFAANDTTVTFTVTDDRAQIIHWPDFKSIQELNLNTSGQPIQETFQITSGNLYATDKNGNPGNPNVTVTLVNTDQSVATYSNGTLTVKNKGEITLRATTTAYTNSDGVHFLAATEDLTFKVRLKGEACEKEQSFTINNSNKNPTSDKPATFDWDEWIQPESIIFNVSNNSPTDAHDFIIKANGTAIKTQSIANDNAETIVTYTFNGNETFHEVTVEGSWLSLGFLGSYGITINSAKLVKKTAVEVTYPNNLDGSTLDFGQGEIDNTHPTGKTVKLNFYNVPDIIIDTTGTETQDVKESFYWEDKTTDVIDCGRHGKAEYVFHFRPKTTGQKQLTVKIKYNVIGSNGQPEEKTYTFKLKGHGTKHNQFLSWNDTSMLHGLNTLSTKNGNISLTGAAKTTAQGLTPSYELVDVTPASGVTTNPIAEIVNNTDGTQSLKINAAGTFKLKAKQDGNASYNAALDTTTLNTFTISRVASAFSISLDELNPKVFGTYGITETRLSTTSDDADMSNGAITISTNDSHASISKNGDKYSVTFKDRVTETGTPVTINASMAQTDIYASSETTLVVTPAKVSPSISWTDPELENPVANSTVSFTLGVMQKGANDPDISSWDESIKIVYSTSDNEFAEVLNNSQINFKKHGQVTIKANIPAGNNNNAATEVSHTLTIACAPQSISWTPAATEYKVGNTITLDASSPANNITYSTSNADIVSTDGVCHKAGYVQITASSADNGVFCEAASEPKSFHVDFEEGKTLNCSPAVVLSTPSNTSFVLTGNSGILVNIGTLTLIESGDDNGEFTEVINGDNLEVTFTPQSEGAKTISLTIKDTDNQEYHLQISATATAPTITFNPTVIGTASTSTNTLDISAITLTSLSSDGNIRLVDNGTEHVLPYNGTITGPLTFKYYPTTEENNAEHTLIVNDTYNIPYYVTSTQRTMAFGETKVGVATAQQQFVMTNFVAADVLTAYISSDEFRINGTRTGSTSPLPIGNGAILNIDFSPRNTCDYTATPAELIISDNGTLYKVLLTGKTEDIEPIDLGTINIGQASEAIKVDDIPQAGTVTVTSTSPYVFRAFCDGDEATLSTATANSSIDVTGKGELYVKFYPEAVGSQSETITISITDIYGETSSYSVTVSGTGVQQTLDVSSTMGQISGTQIALSNMVSAGGYTVSLTHTDEFRINDDVVASTDVSGGSSFAIKLYPKTSGSKSETVTILDKSTNRSYTINLTGTVTALPNLSFNQQKVAKTDVTDNKTITLSGWPANRYELDILDNSETSYAESFLIRGVAGISSLVNGENETVQFRPKKVFNTPLTLYAREKSSGILYPITGITASSIQNDEVQLVWSDNSDPIMIGMNDCSYGFAYAVGLPELNVFYSVSNDNITTCGEATLGIKSGESTPRNHYSGLQGVNNGMTATVTAYILQSDEYLATPITRTFQVTDKLSQEIVCPYDTIVVTNNQSFNVSDLGAYAVDKITKEVTSNTITYNYNGSSVNSILYDVNQDKYRLTITVAGNETYLPSSKDVVVRMITDNICDNIIGTINKGTISGTTETSIRNFQILPISAPADYMDNLAVSGESSLIDNAKIYIYCARNNSEEYEELTNKTNIDGNTTIDCSGFNLNGVTSIKISGSNAYGWAKKTVSITSEAYVHQAKYFNKIANAEITFETGVEQYSKDQITGTQVINYSSLNGPIRYKITGPQASSFKVIGSKGVKNTSKGFVDISCGDFDTECVDIEFSPQIVGLCSAILELYASINKSGTVTYQKIEIPLSGTGTKRAQTISWGQETRLATLQYADFIGKTDAERKIELTAYSNIRGQEITYVFLNEDGTEMSGTPDFVELTDDGKHIRVNGAGTVKLRAKQEGTSEIKAATPVDLDVIVAKADPKLKWDEEYNDDWIYVFGTETIAAHSEPIDGNPSISGSTGKITYSTTTDDLAVCTEEGRLKVKKYGEVTIKAIIKEDDNYLGGEEYAITKKFNPKKVTPVINWAEESLGNYKQGDVVTLENDLAATINKSTDGEPDVTLWSDDIAVVYSSLNTQIATVSGNDVSLNGKKGVVTIQADVPEGTNGNNNAAESKTRTMKVDFADSDIRDCGTAAVLQSCSTTVNLSDEIITSTSSFTYIGSNNSEFIGSINSGVLTVTFTPTSVKTPATQNAVITIKDNSNDEKYHINVKGTATLHQGSINYITTAGHWTFQANAGTKTLTIASNGDIWGDQDEMNGAITLTSDKSNVTVGEDGKTITIVGGNADTDDDVTVTLTASFPGSDRIAACSTNITLTIQKLASGLALNKAELNNNAYVYSTIAMLADGQVSDGELNIEVTPASTHEVSDGYNITLKSCVATTITATRAGTTIYKSGSDNVTFTPKKVTPEITWGTKDLTTDMSQTTYTIADADTAPVSAKILTPEQPSIDDWVDGKNATYSVVGNDGIITLSGERTFTLNKVGYATIKAKVENGDNIIASNELTRHLKVDFNPNEPINCGESMVFESCSTVVDLNDLMVAVGNLTVTVPQGSEFSADLNQDDNTLTIIYSPKTIKEVNLTEEILTITDHGPGGAQYHLHVIGTASLYTPILNVTATKHDNWIFETTPNRATTTIIYGFSNTYDIYWSNTPSAITAQDAQVELDRVTLSLKNPSDATYVEIVDNGRNFRVKQSKANSDDDFTVTLVASYPGLEGKMAPAFVDVPVTIKKTQYTLDWHATEKTIYAGDVTTSLNKPDLTPTEGVSTIQYTYSKDGVITYDGTTQLITLTTAGKKESSVTLIASVESDIYGKEANASITINIRKKNQFIDWTGTDLIDFTTQRDQTEAIDLTAFAKYENPTGANIFYNVTEVSNCEGEGPLIRIDTIKTTTPYTHKLYYTGNGSGTVTITATASGTDDFNPVEIGDSDAKTKTFTISKVGCNVDDFTIDNMHYGDKVTLEPTIDMFTKGTNYQYTLPTVTGELAMNGNVLDVKGVGTSLTISAKKLEDCWVTESTGKVSNTFDIAKSKQEIVWDKTPLGTLQPDGAYHFSVFDQNAYQLATQAFDTLHRVQTDTWLDLDENGKYVTADLTGDVPVGLAFTFDIVEGSVCKTDGNTIVTVGTDGKMHITGNGTGTVQVIASVAGGDYYENVADTITVVIDKAPRTIAWTKPSSLTTASPDITLDAHTTYISENISADEEGTKTYSIGTGGEDYVEIVEGVLNIKDNISLPNEGVKITVNVSFANSCRYADVNDSWTFTLTKVNIQLQNVPTTDILTFDNLTSTTKDFDLKSVLIANYYMTTNYPDGKYSYSFESSNTDIATINAEGKVTAYEMTEDETPLQIVITATETVTGSSDNETIKVVITRGTLIFNVAEESDDNKWTNKDNWSRDDIVASHTDIYNNSSDLSEYNVLIADSCFIGGESGTVEDESGFQAHTVNASCNNLTIDGSNAKLVIGQASVLNVKGSLANDDADRLVLTANYWGQASVAFAEGQPKATIEMFVPQGNGNRIDPIWQYRGICVNDFEPISETWKCLHVFEWNESTNNDKQGQGCWVNEMTGTDIYEGKKTLEPWKGYCFANLCGGPSDDDAIWLTYKGTLVRGGRNIDLQYHYHEYEDDKPFANVGHNLITNSFTVPLKIEMLGYPAEGCDSSIVLYNAGSYAQYKVGGTVDNQRGSAGQFSTVPQETGKAATDIITIPAGQSFFVNATKPGKTLSLGYGEDYFALAPSGRMYMPKRDAEPEFNILKIHVVAKSDSATDQLALLECGECTRQYDNGYDGKKKFGDSGLPQIYAYNKFGITSVNADSSFNKQYVGFAAGSDDETYTLSFETDKLFGYHSLFLTDRKLNETVDILAGETYSFQGYTVGENMRFQINGITEQEWEESNEGDEDDNDDVNACDLRVVGNTLYIEGFTTEHYPAAMIELFDMTGNLAWSTPLTSARIYELPSLPNGIYTIRLGDCHVKLSSLK